MFARIVASTRDFRENIAGWREWSRKGGSRRFRLPIFRWRDAVFASVQNGAYVEFYGPDIHPVSKRTALYVLKMCLGHKVEIADLSRPFHKKEAYTRIRVRHFNSKRMKVLRRVFRLQVEADAFPSSVQGRFVLATLFQQDVDDLHPWLQHYRGLGVDYFILAYNGSANQMLRDALRKESDVLLFDWDVPYWRRGDAWGKSDRHNAQPAFMQWVYHLSGMLGFEWVLTCDLDEFVLLSDQEMKMMLESSSDEIVFENVWAKSESSDSRISLDHQVIIASDSSPRVFRGKSMKRTLTFDMPIRVHYTSQDAVFGGWFLHFAHQTGGGGDRPECDFHWTEPIPVFELSKLLETLNLPVKGKQIDG